MVKNSNYFSNLPSVKKLKPSQLQDLEDFFQNYINACSRSDTPGEVTKRILETLLQLIIEQHEKPYQFDFYHEADRTPFDYYQFGLDFIRPLIDFDHSKVTGLSNLQLILKQLEKGENVFLLSNHQTEPDPQIISLMIEKIAPTLASSMIFIAGHRVVKDPIAAPFSRGRNLVCIYSKRHINHPPEKKAEKISHNQQSLNSLSNLLAEGGKCIFVAPAGGRDRMNNEGVIELAPFDASSIEMLRLLSRKAESKTHFYPLALKTFDIMPPPPDRKGIGRKS